MTLWHRAPLLSRLFLSSLQGNHCTANVSANLFTDDHRILRSSFILSRNLWISFRNMNELQHRWKHLNSRNLVTEQLQITGCGPRNPQFWWPEQYTILEVYFSIYLYICMLEPREAATIAASPKSKTRYPYFILLCIYIVKSGKILGLSWHVELLGPPWRSTRWFRSPC